MTLRVATFNIHHGRGLDERIDLERTASVLKRTGARFIAMQEVDRGMARSGKVDQPGTLSELLGMPVHFFATLRRGSGEYGLAVASSDPIEPEFHAFERLADEEPRGFVTARWNGVTVIATHMSLQRAPNRAHMRALAEALRTVPGPVVVMGDMNAPRTELAPLVATGLEPSPRCHRTLNRPWRRRQIDHVLAGRGARVLTSETIRSDASDHLALAADLETLVAY